FAAGEADAETGVDVVDEPVVVLLDFGADGERGAFDEADEVRAGAALGVLPGAFAVALSGVHLLDLAALAAAEVVDADVVALAPDVRTAAEDLDDGVDGADADLAGLARVGVPAPEVVGEIGRASCRAGGQIM